VQHVKLGLASAPTGSSESAQKQEQQHDPQTLVREASSKLLSRFWEIDLQTKARLDKIIRLYDRERIDASAFHGVNGYGHGDMGREKLDVIIADLMGAEAALVRLQLFSGTHAISSALFGCLRPGDNFLCVSGHPYDTLEEVIGLRDGSQTGSRVGSLMDWGIGYEEVDMIYGAAAEKLNNLKNGVAFDLDLIDRKLAQDPKIKLVHVQRSCGYQWRPSIPVQEIGRLCAHIQEKYKSQGRNLTIFVDNCYGELVEDQEPCHVGADIIAGSLIKNLGGTLAPCGGYIAGRRDLVAAATVHLSAPGVDGGATFNQYRSLFQGLFMAPAIVGESLKGAELVAEVMQNRLGYPCNPPPGSLRTDIIQAVQLGSRKKLISFCEAVQKRSPVGAHIRPVPGMTPGYGDEVIFADGTFIDGSTLELSCDGPLREPFVAFSQGATHWTHWALVLEEALSRPSFSSPQPK
jgi:cystathionine beta-lyase family protein involved in aluminum resistance